MIQLRLQSLDCAKVMADNNLPIQIDSKKNLCRNAKDLFIAYVRSIEALEDKVNGIIQLRNDAIDVYKDLKRAYDHSEDSNGRSIKALRRARDQALLHFQETAIATNWTDRYSPSHSHMICPPILQRDGFPADIVASPHNVIDWYREKAQSLAEKYSLSY